MNIRRIRLLDGEPLGILTGFEHVFGPQSDQHLEPSCFVGANGTGKSRLLQCLAEIFYWLDSRTRLFKPEPESSVGFRFELEYEIQLDDAPSRVFVRNTNDKNRPVVSCQKKGGQELSIVDPTDIRALLPQFVVGYTSGENETLSVPFLDVKQEYAREVAERALKAKSKEEGMPDLRLIMMDYDANFSIIAANFLLQPPHRLRFFKQYLRMSDVDSFRIVIQLHHQRARQKQGVKLTKQLRNSIEQLKKCATAHKFESKEQRWTLDFIINDATRQAFKHFFKSAYELYIVFQRLAMLNDLMITKTHRERINRIRRSQKIVIKPPVPAEDDKVFRFETVRLKVPGAETALDYISLSDGEHQFAHIFGTLLMFDHPNVLFLLDEPESHFNPQWRIKFVQLVNEITRGKHQSILLTSHAPFIVSDCRAKNVQVFRRTADALGVEVSAPKSETYGASFDGLLEDVFDVKPPVARKSLEDLRKLQKEGTVEEIEKRIDEFGDSPEKFYLFQRIEELKSES